jgi:hypothetical protein
MLLFPHCFWGDRVRACSCACAATHAGLQH